LNEAHQHRHRLLYLNHHLRRLQLQDNQPSKPQSEQMFLTIKMCDKSNLRR
jgi:hypothetical protein